MKLLRGLHNPPLNEKASVATIGNFDGVHLGHQSIVERVKIKASEFGLPSMVVVFEPQPLEYFKGEEAPARLMRFREKFECLRAAGLDYLCVLRFDSSFSCLSADAFVKQVLVDHLRIRHLVIGDDFRFGGDREGDFEHLRRSGDEFGFDVERTETYCTEIRAAGDQRVSSTLIRESLEAGRLGDAKECLGRPYALTGRVVYGQQLGRQLGFATANIALKRRKVPLSGVFVVKCIVLEGPHEGAYFGVANVGRKPSVGEFDVNLETHIFDFSGDIYGVRIKVELLHKIRDEQRFQSVDALAEQIQRDNDAARKFVAQQKQPLRLV